jgi:ribA/ribD-fused uncharacterized protein
MKTVNNMALFWGRGDVLSNWHLSTFVVDDIEFNCNEQHMMYKKAMLFGDTEVARRVLAEKDPAGHKALGKQVKPWVEAVWVANRMRIMVDGLYAKFTQNPKMARVLLDTGDTILVEASPYDGIWGVKLGANDPAILNKDTWPGLNLLGQALEIVRSRLRAELGAAKPLPLRHEELRKEFEDWAARHGIPTREQWIGHTYLNAGTRNAWEGFAGARADSDHVVVVKRSTIHSANHLAVTAEGLLDALNKLHEAEESEDATAIEKAEETRSDYFAGVRNAVYEYRKRVPEALMDAATLAASLD